MSWIKEPINLLCALGLLSIVLQLASRFSPRRLGSGRSDAALPTIGFTYAALLFARHILTAEEQWGLVLAVFIAIWMLLRGAPQSK